MTTRTATAETATAETAAADTATGATADSAATATVTTETGSTDAMTAATAHTVTARNTQLVRAYLEVLWNQGRTELAADFLAEDLIQHNHNLVDGRAPLAEFVEGLRKQLPECRFELRRTAAEGDLVFAHSHFTPAPGDAGMAVVDVFRIEDGRIAEHWDVAAAVPETTAGDRPVV